MRDLVSTHVDECVPPVFQCSVRAVTIPDRSDEGGEQVLLLAREQHCFRDPGFLLVRWIIWYAGCCAGRFCA
jgi:hypothetical protein